MYAKIHVEANDYALYENVCEIIASNWIIFFPKRE